MFNKYLHLTNAGVTANQTITVAVADFESNYREHVCKTDIIRHLRHMGSSMPVPPPNATFVLEGISQILSADSCFGLGHPRPRTQRSSL